MVPNVFVIALLLLRVGSEGRSLIRQLLGSLSPTVACLINHARRHRPRPPKVDILLRSTTPLAKAIPFPLGDRAVNAIVAEGRIALPYADPLVIPVGVRLSTESWGCVRLNRARLTT